MTILGQVQQQKSCRPNVVGILSNLTRQRQRSNLMKENNTAD